MPDALGLHRRTPAELQAVIAAERAGTAFLEYRDGDEAQRILALGPDRIRLSIGRLPGAEVALTWDSEVSRAHALLEQVGGAWTIEDRGSSNGTLVNTARINGPHLLRDGDVVRIGRTQLIFHAAGDDDLRRTTPALDRVVPSPDRLAAQGARRALPAGARARGGAASNREIAAALFVSVETVKTHMRALFDAFEVGDVPQYHKRTELVRRALETGLVSQHDLRLRSQSHRLRF